MKLIDWWNGFRRRIDGNQPRATLAGGATRPQDSVDYEPAGQSDDRCGRCGFRIPPDRCAIVAGPVEPDHKCKLYVAGEPQAAANPKPDYVYLRAGTDYKKLLIALIERCGYIVVTGDKKRGGQPGSRAKPHSSKVPPLPSGVKLPTGVELRSRVRILRDQDPKLTIQGAARHILETDVGGPLKAQGASSTRIKAVIDGNLPGLISRYHAKPRKKPGQPRLR